MYDFIMDPTNQFQQNPDVLPNSMPEVSPSVSILKPVGLLLEDTMDLVKPRFLNLVIVGLIGSGLMWLITLIYTKIVLGGGMVNVMPAVSSSGTMLSMLLLVPVMLVISGFMCSSLIGVLQTNDVKAALSLGYSRMFVMAVFMLVFSFVLMGSMLALLVPAIFAYVYGMFAIFITAETGKGGFNSIFESYRIVKGNAFGVAGRLLLLILIAFVISLVMNMIFGDTSALASVASFFVGILLQVFMISYVYSIYTNLKDSKPRPEGYSPTGLSKALTYGAFGLGVFVLVFVTPILLLVNPKAQMDRARDAQMRNLQMQQELPDMESLQEQMPFPELNQ